MTPSVVLVTGVSRYLGGHLAARLAANPAIERVLGVDTVPPSRDLLRRMGRAEFVRADIRNPLIAKVIASAGVDTVVHASLSANPGSSGGRTVMKEMNVIGTMQLLAACQKAPAVRRIVLKSSTAVYGSSSRDPALFDETMTAKDLPSGGYAKDTVEIEGYLRGFSRRRPDVSVTVLRFANFIGPRIDTVLTRYFALPFVPTVLGYDARVQLLHEEDALAVLERATCEELPGVFNVAADGVLLLSQAIRRRRNARISSRAASHAGASSAGSGSTGTGGGTGRAAVRGAVDQRVRPPFAPTRRRPFSSGCSGITRAVRVPTADPLRASGTVLSSPTVIAGFGPGPALHARATRPGPAG